jgi:hypothetical protein
MSNAFGRPHAGPEICEKVMIKAIPAHIEEGRIVTDTPLPDVSEIHSVTVLLEFVGTEPRSAKEQAVSRLAGLLKYSDDPEEFQEDYVRYLEEKYR